jgi:hypothetical protein
MCYRGLSAHRWTTCKPEVIAALIRMDNPPYGNIVLQCLEQLGKGPDNTAPAVAEALLCDYCACFIKERTVRYLPREGGRGSRHSHVAPVSKANAGGLSLVKHEEKGALPNSSAAVQIRKGRKHGMHMAIEHVLSGGSMPAPSRPHFLRCLAILEQPSHPFMAVCYGALGERLSGRKRVRGNDDCVVQWLFEGRPHVFVDPILAKNMRRWISLQEHEAQGESIQGTHLMRGGQSNKTPYPRRGLLKAARVETVSTASSPTTTTTEPFERIWETLLPEPCRFCVRSVAGGKALSPSTGNQTTPRSNISFAGVTAFGKSVQGMETALLEMEREAADTVVEPGVVMYCLRCHRVAAISFEYSRSVRALLGLEPNTTEIAEDAYYAAQIALFRHRRSKK